MLLTLTLLCSSSTPTYPHLSSNHSTKRTTCILTIASFRLSWQSLTTPYPTPYPYHITMDMHWGFFVISLPLATRTHPTPHRSTQNSQRIASHTSKSTKRDRLNQLLSPSILHQNLQRKSNNMQISQSHNNKTTSNSPPLTTTMHLPPNKCCSSRPTSLCIQNYKYLVTNPPQNLAKGNPRRHQPCGTTFLTPCLNSSHKHQNHQLDDLTSHTK